MKLLTTSQANASAILLATLLTASTGCSALFGQREKGPMGNIDMKSLQAAGFNPGAAPVPVEPSQDGRPTVVLEVRDGKKHLERIPLSPDKPTYIGDIVRDAKLTDRLGRINLSIMRPSGTSAPPVRMQVDFDTRGKNVMEEQNYSLRPGDHIVVAPDDTTALDRLMANFTNRSGK